MAIPFAFPSDDDTQANYQRLDQLLSNLFDVLQQILMTQRRIREAQIPQNSPRLRNGQSNSRRNGDGTEPFLSFLPPDLPSLLTNTEARISADMLLPTTLQSTSSSSSPVELTEHNDSRRYGCSASSHARSVMRRRRCRRRTMSESTCCNESKPDNLQEVTSSSQPEPSAQLWTQAEPSQEYEEIKRPCGVESSTADTSLLSMFVPPPFASSVWTAVIFVVGWRLLTRAR
ncbi:hypothetical protein CBL_13979 [Carabus blaptoides fortunei]